MKTQKGLRMHWNRIKEATNITWIINSRAGVWARDKINDLKTGLFSSKRIHTAHSGLQELTESLGNICGEVESDFIDIGSELQTVHEKTANLAAQVMDSVNRFTSQDDEGLLAGMHRLSEKALGSLELCQQEIDEKSTGRKLVMDYLSDLYAIFMEIENIGTLLKIVGVNINIESARSKKAIELFSVVAAETNKLSEKIRRIANDSMDILTTAIGDQERLYRNIASGAAEIKRLGDNANKITKQTVTDIDAVMTSSFQVVEQAGRHSKNISQKIGDLVVAIQFHDSMSQRVEHIVHALEDVKTHLIAKRPTEQSDGHGNQQARTSSIILLQSRQIKEIIHDIKGVYAKSLASFESLLSEIDALIDLLSAVGQSGYTDHKNKDQADPFSVLESSFKELGQVMDKSQALINPERQAASQVSETVTEISNIVSTIHAIGFDTHLMALNAIIKAAHLGQEGGALEILAQEVKITSNQSMGIIAKTDAILQKITRAADKLQEEAAENLTADKMTHVLTGISDTYTHFVENAQSVGTKAEKIKETIFMLKSKLAFLTNLTKTLDDLTANADGLAELLGNGTDGNAAQDHLLLGSYMDRYTMDRERDIHNSVLAQIATPGKENHMPSENREMRRNDQDTESRETDSVVLFTDEEDDLMADVELFDAAEPGQDENLVMFEEKETDLGENVELF